MDTRREFLKKAGLLAGGLGIWNALPLSIKKAMAIDPKMGSTFYDAEHVVFLMQENRSFDHCFGALQGVRGFNDPRVIDLPNKNKVWLQSNIKGETYAPFRLNIKDTKATWMGSLPHSWENQVDARNDGKYDGWLDAKRPGYAEYRDMPLTMGYYNREDIPFYYAFADAFTVCDQHFCSSLTGTTSNRMFFWTGTIKDKPGTPAWVRNSDIGYSKEVSWKTFPERLEEKGVSWKVYQNELSIRTELRGEEEGLLANFTNNNLEWFEQYNVRFSSGHYDYLLKSRDAVLTDLQNIGADTKEDAEKKVEFEKKLKEIERQIEKWSPDNFNKLDATKKALHLKGLATNHKDSDYHQTEEISYTDGEGVERSLKVPKGDIFYEFRKDVQSGKLPTVSWLVAPEYFSDHPTAPWYGAWYVSEVLDILTENPEIWKKTIFILNYDENDGYFDHIPPFVAPNPVDQSTGKTSDDINSADEFVTMEEELEKPGMNPKAARESPVGLGYRVPLIIASPWSRGGWVNSEICDISSTLLFLEKFLNKKFDLNIREENINSWRRAICGDLTSVFRPYHGESIKLPEAVERNTFMQGIHAARFKGLPTGYQKLDANAIAEINTNPDQATPYLPVQERGIRNSNGLKYEMLIEENLDVLKNSFNLCFKSGTTLFGQESLGVAYNVYAPGLFWQEYKGSTKALLPVKTWSFAAKSGSEVSYAWDLSDFDQQNYHLRVYGANGFYREYKGDKNQKLQVNAKYKLNTSDGKAFLILDLLNLGAKSVDCVVKNQTYSDQVINKKIVANGNAQVVIDVSASYNWYDIQIEVLGDDFYFRHLAGRVDTGHPLKTDPLMGKAL